MAEYNLFTLLEKESTDELHLFHSRLNPTCVALVDSICNRMKTSESSKTIFSCWEEDEARMKCAELGRKVCGTCVSNLYADL